jgi:hypothetical protein
MIISPSRRHLSAFDRPKKKSVAGGTLQRITHTAHNHHASRPFVYLFIFFDPLFVLKLLKGCVSTAGLRHK